MMEKLKPCPFCGGEAKAIVDLTKGNGEEVSVFAKCTVCGVFKRIYFDGFHKEIDEYINAFDRVISLWNNRV